VNWRRPLQGERMIARVSRPYKVGEVVHGSRLVGGGGPDRRYWTVTRAWFTPRDEDNQQFESEYSAYVRPSFDEECAPKQVSAVAP
jgi:hypothetical protein